MKPNNWSWQKSLLLLLSFALLFWVIRTQSLASAFSTLARLEARDLLLLVVINLLVLSTFTARWWLLLRAQGQRVSYWRLMGYRLTAFAISYFTPGAHFGGEPYQVFAVCRGHGVPLASSIAAITLDKILEMLINLAFLVVGVLALLTLRNTLGRDVLGPWVQGQLILYSVLLLAIPCLLLVALWRGRHPLSGVITALGKLIRRPLPQSKWAQMLRQSEEQAIWLCRQHPHTVGLAFLVTLLTWVGVIGEFWFLTRVLGLSLTPLQVTASLVAARIALLVPVPAGLGALEAGQMVAMNSVGIDPSIGIAIALVIRGRDVLSGLVGLALGGAHIWQQTTLPPLPTSQWPAVTPETAASSSEPQQSKIPPIVSLLCALGLLLAPVSWLPVAAQAPHTVVFPPDSDQIRIPLVIGEAAAASACPLVSANAYEPIAIQGAPRNADPPPLYDPDLNLDVRGFTPATTLLKLIAINGPTDDDAPQLAHLFQPARLPLFTAAHQVHDWDWACCPGGALGAPIAEPEVTLIEMATTPGELLYPPQRNAHIHRDFVALVLYAEPSRLTVTYTREDTPARGYVVHVENLCVDPVLLALYQEMHARGRGELPALRRSDSIGTAVSDSVMVAVRDSGSFMDPRSGKDWWQESVRLYLETPVASQDGPTSPLMPAP